MTMRHEGRLTRLTTTAALTAILGGLIAQSSASAADRHHPPRHDVSIDRTAPVITRDDIVIRSSLRTVWRLQTDIDNWPS